MPAVASYSLWANNCSRFFDENSLFKRFCVWRLGGGRWFIPPILRDVFGRKIYIPGGMLLLV